ncbi:dTDP-glucose 4,6-dehydratase [Streptomyces sp. NPDC048001]|uniref:dTDP-glucose 4,6-dehydratase n=1 Tax=Streptomyces sp. NPDC048001 TaxID=3365498 RepID=UPI0037249102
MRLLVTGGAGFIGSHFLRLLLPGPGPGAGAGPGRPGPEEPGGFRVTVLDKLGHGSSGDALRAVERLPGFRFVRGAVEDAALVDRLMPGHDAVVHLAAESHVDRSIEGAVPFAVTSAVGTQVLLDAARRHGVGRFLQVSTDEVYGSVADGAWTEEQPLAPRSPYAAAKAAGDLLALACHVTHGLDVVITRGSNTYGPRQYPEKIIPLFATRLLDGLPVPLYGDGQHVRDWLHVEDHCRGILAALTSGRSGEVYHLGGGCELTNRDLTGRILREYGAGWESVRRHPDRKAHDRRYALDCAKADTELGWRPRIPFARGLRDTLRWYRENRDWWEPLTGAADASRGAGRAAS